MGRKNRITFLVFLVLQYMTVEIGLYTFVFGCQKAEKEALLMLKHSFSDPANRLSSWKGQSDCCQWEGVKCDNVTAYVITLDLRNRLSEFSSQYDNPMNISNELSTKKLDPALLELRKLRYLDLSGNDFQESPIPRFIGLMKNLRYLNLSKAGFGGVIPLELGNLTRLQTLDLGGDDGGVEWSFDSQGRIRLSLVMSSSITVTHLHWVAGLSSLQYLNMNGIDLSETNSSIQALNRLPSLSELRFQGCGLGNTHLSHAFSNSSTRIFATLTHLDLSFNNLEGPLPHLFANLSSLRSLDLVSNVLNGSIPLWLSNMGALESLFLRWNSFSQVEGGTIMGILAKNPCNLKVLDLSENRVLGGEILGPYENVSQLQCKLESLQLGYNDNICTLPYWLGELRNLKILDLRSNRFRGSLPTSIGNLSLLEELHLHNNGLSGSIPSSLGGLSSLRILDLSWNSLQGTISDSHLVNLSSSEKLYLYNNSLKWELSFNWMPPFQLSALEIGSCAIKGHQLPQWIQSQKRLNWLDLSDTGISGNMPEWFWNMNLLGFDLSHNHITGPLKHFSSQLSIINLSHNLLSGPLPHDISSPSNDSVQTSLCRLRNLEFLDLSKNELSGTIPDCWRSSKDLSIINLSFNKLSGLIPKSIGLNSGLEYLKLSNNLLEGQIPTTLSKCEELILLDIGENKLSGKIPSWGGGSQLQIIRLRANKLDGVIPKETCSLPQLQVLDLAQNNLTGSIPQCLGHLSAMSLFQGPDSSLGSANSFDEKEVNAIEVLKGKELKYTTTLKFLKNLDLSSNGLVGTIPEELANLTGLQGMNLSHNYLIGNIPQKIGQMKSLESLDLSNNNLSGTIPSNIATLTFLSHLNLSYNKLHGEIPTGNQLQTLNDPFIYTHNIGLCGDPLPNKCTRNHSQQQKGDNKEGEGEGEDTLEKVLFYVVIMLGFATGFWGVVGTILLKKSLRYFLFQLADNIIDYLYVQIVVRIKRLRN